MKSFKQFVADDDRELGSYILSEAIHASIQSAMDAETRPAHKLNAVVKTARNLIAKGEDTGLENDKPKKGSSRAVFFPKEHKKINLDGHDVETPSAVKIAFSGALDKYNRSGKLLGQHQNQVESDWYAHKQFGIIDRDSDTGKWHTNDEGILPPHFGHHEDHHHLEMGKVEKFSSKDFKEATKHPDHPKGISHQEFYDAVNSNWANAHGQRHLFNRTSPERIEEIQDHPLVSKVNDFVAETDNHPTDMHKGNMGLWHHPVTGKKHVVLSDFGYSKQVAKEYNDARKLQSASMTRRY